MTSSTPRIPEADKKPGVQYALTDDGIELPVVDLTHPAFQFDVSDVALAVEIERFISGARRRRRLPKFLLNLLFKVLVRKSVLGRGLMEAADRFMPGVVTYLFKLGPEMLGSGWAQPLDRRIAATMPAMSMRLRMLDMARFLVEGTMPALATRRSPLHLINLGGGPSSDSWNALLLLRASHPELLNGRAIRIHTLDRDVAGPAFGRRALAALKEPGAPLQGLDVTLTHTPYDWTRPADLRPVIGEMEGEAPIVATSSEGALFEYASDAEVTANLEMLHQLTPADAVVVGSTTSDEPVAMQVHQGSRIQLRPRSMEAFAALVEAAGWTVAKLITRPTCRDVLLLKR